MYSQNNEESVIINYFKSQNKQHGRFLDIGAYDGKTFSNTHKLAEIGWSGVCYEPSPKPFESLRQLYKDNKNIVVVNSAISKHCGNILFYDSSGNAISTTSLVHKELWEKGSKIKYKQIVVSSVTPSNVLSKFGLVYDFVNIDTEGTNCEILELFVSAGLKFNLLCIEHDGYEKKIMNMFPGCIKLIVNGENIIIKV